MRKWTAPVKSVPLLTCFLASIPHRSAPVSASPGWCAPLNNCTTFNLVFSFRFLYNRPQSFHIRRLRSKIEDRKHTFIETIRNIGYKFIAE